VSRDQFFLFAAAPEDQAMGFPFDRQQNDPLGGCVLRVPIINPPGWPLPAPPSDQTVKR
jgi:hypothetical protein